MVLIDLGALGMIDGEPLIVPIGGVGPPQLPQMYVPDLDIAARRDGDAASALAGVMVGTVASLVATRLMTSLIYGVSGTGLITCLIASAAWCCLP
jgi:hypothetical protein